MSSPRSIETHEPRTPLAGWPYSHADAAPRDGGASPAVLRVEMTDLDVEECIVVRIDSARHYLHTTTAEALRDRLAEVVGDHPRSVTVTIHGASHNLRRADAGHLHAQLVERIAEWTVLRDEHLARARAEGLLP